VNECNITKFLFTKKYLIYKKWRTKTFLSDNPNVYFESVLNQFIELTESIKVLRTIKSTFIHMLLYCILLAYLYKYILNIVC